MRKNQKYSQEEMYFAIEKWQSGKLSQYEFCKRENMAISTFGYWNRKYRKVKSPSKPSPKKPIKTFIPLEISKTIETSVLRDGQIHITYPNGVQLSCPASIDIQQLKTLINL